MVSCSKILLIPVTLIITGFLILKKKYNLALIVLSTLFLVSIIFNNKIETFQNNTSSLENTKNTTRVIESEDTNIEDTKNTTRVIESENTNIEDTKNTTRVIESEDTNIEDTKNTTRVIESENTNIEDTKNTTRVIEREDTNIEDTKNTTNVINNLDESGTESERETLVTTSVKKDEIHRMNLLDYNQIFFVFNALIEPKYLKKNKESIDNIIDVYKINNIFDLSKKVLNRSKNPIYNNFLEKITCRENGRVNYILCDNKNYKKMFAFCELLYVFTLDLDKIIELINKFNIMAVCELSANRSVLISPNSQSSYGYETLGLEYYLNEKSFTDKYYDILKILKLDDNLDKNPNEYHLSLREQLYNYRNSNKKVVKDLNSIMVLFDYYNIFDRYVLNIEDDDYNWNLGILKSVDLNMPCWDNVSFFIDYDVKERIIEAINRITSVDDEFLTRGKNPSNPFSERNTRFDVNVDSKIEQNSNTEGYQEETDLFSQDLQTFSKRFKEIKAKQVRENNMIEKKLNTKLNLQYFRENFGQKMVDITEDIVQLYSKKCNLECNDNKNQFYAKFIFYLGEVFKILTKDNRMLFVGILFIILSIILNFIVASK
jgi:hypothetical protein